MLLGLSILSGGLPCWVLGYWHKADYVVPHSSVTKQDIEKHFESHGTGKITEIKLMNGFGFLEYEDAMDARDVVPGNYITCRDKTLLIVQL